MSEVLRFRVDIFQKYFVTAPFNISAASGPELSLGRCCEETYKGNVIPANCRMVNDWMSHVNFSFRLLARDFSASTIIGISHEPNPYWNRSQEAVLIYFGEFFTDVTTRRRWQLQSESAPRFS